jgi:hypothetical protein
VSRILKHTIMVLLVTLRFFGSVRATMSQIMPLQVPWSLKVSPAVVNTGIPQCWATFTVSVTGSTDLDIRMIFRWFSLSSGNLHYDETLSTVGRKAPFQFDVVVEGIPALANDSGDWMKKATYDLEVSAHVDSPNNSNWLDYSLQDLNQKATITIITPSQYPSGGYCALYTYTLANANATMTHTTIDVPPHTTTSATHTSDTGTPEKSPQSFWEQIPTIVLLAAVVAILIVVGVALSRHRHN